MLEGVFIDQTIERLFQLAGHFRRSSRAWTIDQAWDSLAGKTMDPLAESGIGKERVSETVCRRCPCTTLRTAWARRKTWASLVCLRKVSKVGSASSGKWSVRVRI